MNFAPQNTMNEETTKLNYITPAITAKWTGAQIVMEAKITDGKINMRGNANTREAPKKADYLLFVRENYPIAVVEAKDMRHDVSFGLQQAKEYARMLDVPFAYSSNGTAFFEHDRLTGVERQLRLDEFPSPEELLARAEKSATEAENEISRTPYYSSQTTHAPRYYQRIAINRTLSAIAKGQRKILLVMATGTGKTYVAFQIAYRLLQSGMKKKLLYLADRNILVDQTIQQDFAPLEKVIHKISVFRDDRTTLSAYQAYFSLYQQLVGDEGQEYYRDLFAPDFFDLIIVDECHRGSAKEESRWRKILEYFSGATQIGMTATPKETKYISNVHYFGDPIFTYSLKEGIADGFLAPFRVFNITTNIGEGWRPIDGQCDIFGKPIEDRTYTNSDYDYTIVIQDRIDAVAREITDYLKSTDRMAKTIVFCATEDAAERMRIALNNLNADMVRVNPDYVVRITGSDAYGKSKLSYFINVNSDYPVIATTSQLLSTGVDCKMTKLIVLDKMIGSMTEFKQIIGRGTRLREDKGKTSFAVMDFRGVTRLFEDPEWDGPIEPAGELRVREIPPKPDKPQGGEKTPLSVIDKEGCTVRIINKVVRIYDPAGKLLVQEDIIDYTKTNILGEYASLENFIQKWTEQDKKIAIADALREKGIDLEALKAERGMSDVDDFDFICHVAYGAKPLTRKERANNVKKRDFLSKYSGVAREVLENLLQKYMNTGIYEIEKIAVLKLEPFDKWGKPFKIIEQFGGEEAYLAALRELEEQIYQVA